MREAATRVFSNASGSYSSNVNLAVENSSWQDESQLQEMYMQRKSFAFNSDRCAPVQLPACGSFWVPLLLTPSPALTALHLLTGIQFALTGRVTHFCPCTV